MPLGILQIISILERDHKWVKFQLYDANAHRIDDVNHGNTDGLDEVLRSDDFDVVAIGGLITGYNYIKQAVRRVKEFQPHVKIVAGGGFYSSMPYEMMNFLPEIDYGVTGEAYLTFPELLKAIKNNEDVTDVKGIFYRRDSSIKFSQPRELIPEMDWLPFPSYKYAPLEIYFKYSELLLSEISMTSKKRLDACFSLSCPFLCRFCWDLGITSNYEINMVDGKPQYDGGRPGRKSIVRQHSPEYIARYIEYLRREFLDIPRDDEGGGIGDPIDFLGWSDENIVAHDAQTGFTWLKEIREELWKKDLVAECVKRGVAHDPSFCNGPHFGGTSHAGLVNKEMLKTLRDIGFTYLDYGLEHWDSKILKSIGKGSTPDTNKRAVNWTLEMGIRPIPNQIIMFPDESWETLNTMLDAMKETGIVSMPFICTPYPGSEWYTKYKEYVKEQYDGNLEKFVSDLEDATKPTALLTKRFTPAEAVGIQHIIGHAAISRDFNNAKRLLSLSKKMKESQYVQDQISS
ncbi:MAG TPA: radical SAM protein [Nitrosopumilaceae archaeon]|nr:radical SAM protein [Nitrosopumilaceae archaeon]